jgi:hypothetical protein
MIRNHYDRAMLPKDVVKYLSKKYHVEPAYIYSLYVTWWQAAAYKVKHQAFTKIKKASDCDINIPHMGRIFINRKYFKYVKKLHTKNREKLNLCDTKI